MNSKEMIVKYKEHFHKKLPLETLECDDKELIRIIDECLCKNKTAEELGYVEKAEDGVYQ